MSLPLTQRAWHDISYVKGYGEARFFKDINLYGKINGSDWADEVNARRKDDTDYRLEEFHKEVVLPVLKAARNGKRQSSKKQRQVLLYAKPPETV